MLKISSSQRRLPELHLRQLTREDISLPRPEFHLPSVAIPELDLREAIGKFEMPDVSLPSMDIGRTIADAAAAVRRPRAKQRRRRWPLRLAGLVVAAAGTWLLLGSDVGRAWLERANVTVRDWVASMRRSLDHGEMDDDAPSGAGSAESASIPAATGASTNDTVEMPVEPERVAVGA